MAPQSRWIAVYVPVWLAVACYYYLEPVVAQNSGQQVVKILAVFDQADMEMMTRVLHKTLAAHNRENSNNATPGEPSSSDTAKSSLDSSARYRKNIATNNPIRMEAVIYSAPWWINQTADDVCRLLLDHKPVAILALADEKAVFQVAVVASGFDIPVVGIRSGRDLDDSSFQVSAQPPPLTRPPPPPPPPPVFWKSIAFGNLLQICQSLRIVTQLCSLFFFLY